MKRKKIRVDILKSKNKLSRKRGSELAETVLIMAISVVLIVTLFYPQIVSLLSNTIASLGDWFTIAVSRIGIM